MNIIIYDTEYTSWHGSLENNWSREDEYRELVQLSAIKIKINENDITIEDTFSEYCIPTINSCLSDYFINLTGITNNIIKNKGYKFNATGTSDLSCILIESLIKNLNSEMICSKDLLFVVSSKSQYFSI